MRSDLSIDAPKYVIHAFTLNIFEAIEDCEQVKGGRGWIKIPKGSRG